MERSLPKRPPLIWFTQLLVLVFALVFLVFLAATALALPQLLATYRSAPWLVFVTVLTHALLLAGLVALSAGLLRRQRWAWPGSNVFALLLLALVVASRVHPANGPIPILPIPPAQLFGATVGEVVIFVALVVYPLRLFLSRKVRSFFNVAQGATHVP